MYTFTVTVAGKEDAEFMASSVRGVAETNSIQLVKGKDEKVACELVELPENFLSDELREKILSDQDFLRDYAHAALVGDGMEYDTARRDLDGMDDLFIAESYLASNRDNDDLIPELRQYSQLTEQIESFDREQRAMREEEEEN